MVPLGYLAATVPLAFAIGIRGIGAAPALVALFLYSLCPWSPTPSWGSTRCRRKWSMRHAAWGCRAGSNSAVKLPLALPVILTGIRIVLGAESRPCHRGGVDRRRWPWHVHLQGIGADRRWTSFSSGRHSHRAMAFAAAVILDAIIDSADGTALHDRIDHLTKRLGDTLIVDDVSMVVELAPSRSRSGTSGAVKSTLLRMINGLIARIRAGPHRRNLHHVDPRGRASPPHRLT